MEGSSPQIYLYVTFNYSADDMPGFFSVFDFVFLPFTPTLWARHSSLSSPHPAAFPARGRNAVQSHKRWFTSPQQQLLQNHRSKNNNTNYANNNTNYANTNTKTTTNNSDKFKSPTEVVVGHMAFAITLATNSHRVTSCDRSSFSLFALAAVADRSPKIDLECVSCNAFHADPLQVQD